MKQYLAPWLTLEDETNLIAWIHENYPSIFGRNNYKITVTGQEYDYKTVSFDLLAGHTCPAASLCHSMVVKDATGKRSVKDLGKFRCYATKSEVAYSNVYDMHESNKSLTELDIFPMVATYFLRLMKITLVRIHSSGDFYNFEYFKKWIQIAQMNPHITFFGYTKQATFYKYLLSHPVDNMKIVYSMGGIHDGYAIKNNLPSCTVVTSDYLYHDSHTTIETLEDGSYKYTYRIEKTYGKNVKVTMVEHISSMYLEYGTFYNPIKKCIENLSCMHDSRRQSVDDFERIMRQESFGIIFH